MARHVLRPVAMHGRLSTLAFALYVALDLSNPFHPGAFNFDPDECVEAARFQEPSHDSAAVAPESRPNPLHEATTHALTRVRHLPAPQPRPAWQPPARVIHAEWTSSAPPPTEDH